MKEKCKDCTDGKYHGFMKEPVPCSTCLGTMEVEAKGIDWDGQLRAKVKEVTEAQRLARGNRQPTNSAYAEHHPKDERESRPTAPRPLTEDDGKAWTDWLIESGCGQFERVRDARDAAIAKGNQLGMRLDECGMMLHPTGDVLHLAIREDGVNYELLYNPKEIAEVSDDELAAMLLHELGHIAHNGRFHANLATDLAINEDLVKAGLAVADGHHRRLAELEAFYGKPRTGSEAGSVPRGTSLAPPMANRMFAPFEAPDWAVEAGAGKTSMVKEVAEALGLPVVTMVASSDPEDLDGLPNAEDDMVERETKARTKALNMCHEAQDLRPEAKLKELRAAIGLLRTNTDRPDLDEGLWDVLCMLDRLEGGE